MGDWRRHQRIEEQLASPSEGGKNFKDAQSKHNIQCHRPGGSSGLDVSLKVLVNLRMYRSCFLLCSRLRLGIIQFMQISYGTHHSSKDACNRFKLEATRSVVKGPQADTTCLHTSPLFRISLYTCRKSQPTEEISNIGAGLYWYLSWTCMQPRMPCIIGFEVTPVISLLKSITASVSPLGPSIRTLSVALPTFANL